MPVGTALFLGAWLRERTRGERAAAGLWLVLLVTTPCLFTGLKQVVRRARPDLWPRLLEPGSYAFPSGHALFSATFFPLMAFTLARRFPRAAPALWALGLLLPLYIGFGRMYLGVHWPSDVLAGWALGALQSGLGIAWLGRKGYPSRSAGLDSSSQAEPSA
jgi:undecaprenyl-diphosphatase